MTQKVIINGQISEEKFMISGVPKGSILCPLLFLIMIDSISELETNRETIIGIFAGNTCLLRRLRSDKDSIELQEDLQCLYTWAEESNM